MLTWRTALKWLLTHRPVETLFFSLLTPYHASFALLLLPAAARHH